MSTGYYMGQYSSIGCFWEKQKQKQKTGRVKEKEGLRIANLWSYRWKILRNLSLVPGK